MGTALHRMRLRRNPIAIADGCPKIEPELVDRIADAYRSAPGQHLGESMWEGINARKRDVHDALLEGGNRLQDVLLDPGCTDFFYGFDDLFAARVRRPPLSRWRLAAQLTRQLIALAHAVGSVPVPNPEYGVAAVLPPANGDDLLDHVERVLGPIDFPTPFPAERGIATRRGIASYRALHALFQAWRTKNLASLYGGRVLEIGGGLGRSAYYSHRFGVDSYTIVDIPLTGAAQAAFLGQTLSPDQVTLSGETPQTGAVRLLRPDQLPDIGPVDIVVNADGLTELDEATAQDYADFIADHARAFLSLNHEANPYRVRDLKLPGMACVYRAPHCMRPGYVEELYVRT
ncbi:putative sugar O-methyltransferase [Mycobacterium sp. M23085]|uniref:putative sugar O-methyltransferase n=1 Tax=Mycobacterium sp. M23085 TaxID=3378087 RepID=UPI003877E858